MSDLPGPECRHRGAEFAPGRFVCRSTQVIAPRGVTPELCCNACPCIDHPAEKSEAATPGHEFGSGYGVVIGTYDSHVKGRRGYGAEAIRLNLTVLRATCGPDVHVLVCDDCSPPPARNRMAKVCAEFNAEFFSNPSRMGHTSGDMIVFFRAVEWGARLGLRTVTKLSHRMIIDVPNWVQTDSEELLATGYATQAQLLTNFPGWQLRTECVMMAVRQWNRPQVLSYFEPRKITGWNEGHTFNAIQTLVDPNRPFPCFLPWPRLSYVRGNDLPPVYFRQMAGSPQAAFTSLAGKYAVRLSDNFSLQDSILSANYMP